MECSTKFRVCSKSVNTPAPSCTSTAILGDGPFATLQPGVMPFTFLLHADEHVTSWVMHSCAAPPAARCVKQKPVLSLQALPSWLTATWCATAMPRGISRPRSAPLCFVPAGVLYLFHASLGQPAWVLLQLCRAMQNLACWSGRQALLKLYRGQFLNRSWRCSSAVQLLVWAVQLCPESE